jgi:hypothetical protein
MFVQQKYRPPKTGKSIRTPIAIFKKSARSHAVKRRFASLNVVERRNTPFKERKYSGKSFEKKQFTT